MKTIENSSVTKTLARDAATHLKAELMKREIDVERIEELLTYLNVWIRGDRA